MSDAVEPLQDYIHAIEKKLVLGDATERILTVRHRKRWLRAWFRESPPSTSRNTLSTARHLASGNINFEAMISLSVTIICISWPTGVMLSKNCFPFEVRQMLIERRS